MVMAVTIDPGAFAKIRGIQRQVRRLPQGVAEASNEFGKSLARRVKRNIMAKRLIWRGNLHQSVRWHQKKSIGWLSMLKYGVELQERRPKSVVVDRRMKLWSWARDPSHHRGAGKFTALLKKIRKRQPIQLRRYDVYATPFRRAEADIPKIIDRHVKKIFRTKI